MAAAKTTRDPQRAQKILSEAARLFHEKGFHAVTVDEIGEAAGATGAAIYRHFESKEELLSTLFDEAQDRYLLTVPDRMEDPQEELETLIDRTMALTLEQRELATVWARENRALSAPYLRRLHRRERQYVDRWVACLHRRFPEMDDEDLRVAARAAIGTMNSLAARTGPVPDQREVEIVRSMILGGLQTIVKQPHVRVPT